MTDRADEQQLTGLLKRIVDECRHPARLIELYYWSAENELAEVMRQYIALPPEVRAALHAFLLLAKDEPGSVTTRIGARGELRSRRRRRSSWREGWPAGTHHAPFCINRV